MTGQETLGFSEWVRNNPAPYKSRGARSAWELGAKDALRSEYDNSYSRNDCMLMYHNGYYTLREYLQRGGRIRCDCCGTIIQQTNQEEEL